MNNELLLLIITTVCFASLGLERRIAWLGHISGVCMIIIIALILSMFGLIPNSNPIYDFFMGPVIPIAIALLIFGLNLKEVVQLPKSLLLIYLVGVLATMAGSIFTAVLFRHSLGENAPKLAAQLAASYIGGGENAAAMRQILGIKNEVFVAAFAVDNIATSVWMIATIVLARSKPVEAQLGHKDAKNFAKNFAKSFDGMPVSVVSVFLNLALALTAHQLSVFLSSEIGFFHPILYLSLIALILGQIPIIRENVQPAYIIGSTLFAPFFFSIGAVSDISQLSKLPTAIILMPLLIVAIHGILIYSFGYFLKTPSLETSLASQSLIGGPATAVALAQAKKWKSGISIGLVIGLVGYATGNYFAIMVFRITAKLISIMGHNGW